jgi:FtsP/CotA-like multicopper oxidase with cupredoxin domain
VTPPAALSSSNGKLEVNFSFVTGTDSNGLTTYCYINPDTGDQAPTLRVNAGDQLIIHFKNNISSSSAAAKAAAAMPGMVMTSDAIAPATAAATTTLNGTCGPGTMTAISTNLHFHGMNVSPTCHQDDVITTIVQPGSEFDYSVQIPANEPSGMYWYHPHPHGFSEAQLLGGATGAIIVEGIQNFNSGVVGLPERILVIRDHPIQAAEAGVAGAPAHDLSLNNVPVIFPAYTPSLLPVPASTSAKPIKEFWRIANTASDTLVNLEYTIAGVAQTVQVIAIDGVPLTDGSGNPVTNPVTSVLLPAGARAEFIVTTPQAGQTAQLVAEDWNNGSIGSTLLDYDPTRPLANIVASTSTSDSGLPIDSFVPAVIPEITRSTPPLRFNSLNTATPAVQRSLYFSANLSSNAQFFITIAGQTPAAFSPGNPPNIVTQIGTVEQWTVSNQSPMDHAFHIHQIHFRVLAINGSPVTDYTEHDTIDVPHWTGTGPYPSVTLLMDFTDPGIAGTFVYHCHILNHEDRGMMGSILVANSATGLTASSTKPTPGESVTLTATVTPLSSTTIPTGTVTFRDGATTLGTATLNGSGVAALATTALPTGTDSVTAVYSGDSNFTTSTSSALTMNVALTPTITSISHNYGAIGAVNTITGANFGITQASSTITFNGAAGAPTAWSATSITVAVPTGATSGNIVVTVGGHASNGISFSVYPDPTITAISPTSGPAGTVITVTGTNLKDPENLGIYEFNGATVTPTSITATSVVLTVPTGAASGKISIMSGGVFATSQVFTVTVPPVPTITKLSHNYGAPGAVNTITGTNFGTTQGTSTVTFNGTRATPGAWNATSITVPVPAGATTGNIVVTVGGAASNGSAFTIYSDPTISGISPTSGPVGTVITVTGTNLKDPENLGLVQFDGVTVTPTGVTATSMQLTVPTGATSGKVTVISSGVTAASQVFTVTAVPVPTITRLSHNYGAPGAVNTITGTNFGASQGASRITFNGTVAKPTAWNATSITVPVPAGATTGNIVVTVGGEASNGSAFTVYPDPTITGISPTSGTVGTVITVTGTYLADPESLGAVLFNGVTVTPTLLTNTSVKLVVPSGATTGKVVIYSSGVPATSAVFTVN